MVDTISQALQEVRWGDISHAEALTALYSGIEQPVTRARSAASLRHAAQRDGACYWLGDIPHKDGVFLAPNLWEPSRALSVAQSHPRGPDHAIRWRAKMADRKVVGTLAVIGVEIDDVPLEEQAARLDELAYLTGRWPSLVIMSGDPREGSPGKSLHAFWALKQGAQLDDWRRAVDLLIGLLGADTACRNPGRAWRAPSKRGKERVQTTIWAEPSAHELPALLADLERVAEDRGIETEVEAETGKASRARISTGANYAAGWLAPQTEVTAADGRRYRLDVWPEHLDEEVRCWAPTERGLVRSSGERRDQPGATLRIDERTGQAVVACHIEQVLYRPERPLDPALASPPLPPPEMPYLGEVELNERVVVMRCDTGTGKTQTLAEQTAPSRTGRPRITISPRVAISRDVARRYGATCYLDVEGDISLTHDPDVVVTINSVRRLYAPPGSAPTLVLEESEQLAQSLFGGTIPQTGEGSAVEVLDVLCGLAEQADRIICADAFAGEATAALLDVLAPGEARQTIVLGRARPAPVTVWDERLAMLDALEARLAAGERAIVASATKSAAEDLARAMRDKGYRVRCYTSDTDESERQDLADVHRWWSDEYADLVVYSPAISAGVSYDPPEGRFDVAAMLAPLVDGVDWTTCAQMLDRARKPGEVWLWVPEVEEPLGVPTVRHIRERRAAEWRASVQTYAASHGFDVELPAVRDDQAERGLLDIAVAVEHARACRQSDRRADLVRYLEARGAPVAYSHEQRERLREALREARAKRLAEYGQRVEDAETLSPGDLKQLERQGAWSAEEVATLRRQELLERYGRIDAELASADHSDTVWRQTRELVRAGLVVDGHTRAAAGKDLDGVESGVRSSVRARVARALGDVLLVRTVLGDEQLARILEPVRAPAKGEQGRAVMRDDLSRDGELPGLRWTPSAWDADELAREYRYQLRRHGISSRLARVSPTALAEDPQRWLGRTLNRWGLATHRQRERVEVETGAGRVDRSQRRSVYRLDLPRWRERCALAQRRAVSERGHTPRRVWDAALISSRRGSVIFPGETCETLSDFCPTSGSFIEEEPRMWDSQPPDWRLEAADLEAESLWSDQGPPL